MILGTEGDRMQEIPRIGGWSWMGASRGACPSGYRLADEAASCKSGRSSFWFSRRQMRKTRSGMSEVEL